MQGEEGSPLSWPGGLRWLKEVLVVSEHFRRGACRAAFDDPVAASDGGQAGVGRPQYRRALPPAAVAPLILRKSPT